MRARARASKSVRWRFSERHCGKSTAAAARGLTPPHLCYLSSIAKGAIACRETKDVAGRDAQT
jgi:hypothetical protein